MKKAPLWLLSFLLWGLAGGGFALALDALRGRNFPIVALGVLSFAVLSAAGRRAANEAMKPGEEKKASTPTPSPEDGPQEDREGKARP